MMGGGCWGCGLAMVMGCAAGVFGVRVGGRLGVQSVDEVKLR